MSNVELLTLEWKGQKCEQNFSEYTKKQQCGFKKEQKTKVGLGIIFKSRTDNVCQQVIDVNILVFYI
jgi:hypothetical protein